MFDKEKMLEHLESCQRMCREQDMRSSTIIYTNLISMVEDGYFDTGCPMTRDVPLSPQQVERFCALGCSVDCPKLLKIFLEGIEKAAKDKDAERILLKRHPRYAGRGNP